MRALFPLILGAFLSSVACSSTDPAIPPSVPPDEAGVADAAHEPVDAGLPDVSTVTDAAPDAADASVACNTMINEGPVVNAVGITDPLPAGAGGAVANGTYVLTAVTYAPQSDGGVTTPKETWQQTLVLNAGTNSGVSARNGKEMRIEGTYTTSGTEVTFAETCPAPATRGPFGYTATPTEISVFIASDRRTLRYTKQ